MLTSLQKLSAKDIIDISPLLAPCTAVYPMDTSFSRRIELDFQRGDNLLLSSIQTTLHLGAHADASNHYHPKGVGIHERRLEDYLGLCQVISVKCAPRARIRPSDFAHVEIQAPRILFRTNSFPNPNQWTDEFNSLSPELVDLLAQKKVRLIGIDTPSVDPSDSKELESHQRIYAHDLAVLEGLVLTEAKDGLYDLIALPLRLNGADASPVRAILLRRDRS